MTSPVRQDAPGALRIVKAGVEDLDAISCLADRIWRQNYRGMISEGQIEYMLEWMYDPARMRREILEENVVYESLFLDGKMIGYVSYGPSETAGELKLHKLYIDLAYQRKGLGSAAMKHVERFAVDNGYNTLILAVNRNNIKAIGAYIKNGFAIRKSVVTDIGGGYEMDDYILEKALTR